MKRKIDLDKVEAALQKAGRDALTGSRDVRSGRFIPRGAAVGEVRNKPEISKSKLSRGES